MISNVQHTTGGGSPRHARGMPRVRGLMLAAASVALGIGVLPPAVQAENDSGTDSRADTLTSTTTSAPPTTPTPVSTTAPIPPPPPPTTTPATTVSPTTVPPTTAPPSATTTTPTVPETTAVTLPPPPAAQHVTVYPSQIAHILATIRYLESRGNYVAPPNRGRASGAYQFITSTWNNYGGYANAYLAPPEVQDERAAADVMRILEQWNNDVSMVPVMWYYPRAAREPALMDIVPMPSAGNVLTVREYQQRWLAVWAFTSGQPIPQTTPLSLGDALARMGFAPDIPRGVAVDPGIPADERTATIAFPILGPTRVAAPDCGDATDDVENADASASAAEIEAAGLCADQAPGIIFGVKLQPVLAPVDGVVTEVVNEPGRTISVTITDPSGRSFRLSGFNDDNPGTDDGAAPEHLRLTSLARVGSIVHAGQVIGFMGDTDPLPIGVRADVPTDATVTIAADAIAPHIRLTIVDLDGTPIDAYGPVIDALFRQYCTVGIGPWSGWGSGQGAADAPGAVTIETTDDNREIDSEWVITPSGDVIASGWAAMIYPSESCGWAPAEKRGPGTGGPLEVPDSWATPIELATPIWVALAVRGDPTVDVPVMRR